MYKSVAFTQRKPETSFVCMIGDIIKILTCYLTPIPVSISLTNGLVSTICRIRFRSIAADSQTTPKYIPDVL